MYDSHMHTPLCKHAVGTPSEYAAAGYARGLAGIHFTCHNPLPDGLSSNVRMAPEAFEQYLSLVQDARDQWAGRLAVGLGLECDFLPGFGIESWLETQAASADFDYLLVSIHPHIADYRSRFWQDDPVAYQKLYFDHLAASAEFGLHDALAHPDLVKNISPEAWDANGILDHIRHNLDRIARTGLAMEINTSGWIKNVKEVNPGLTILREIAARNIPVVLGSDAHHPERVGDRFLDALDHVQEAGIDEVHYFIRRKRHTLLIADARSLLTKGNVQTGESR